MNRTDSPAKQSKPFGVNGPREPILSTTPAGDNTASYDAGFPPITMVLKSAGGLPPKGQDMNQILYELSALGRWASAGAKNTYDSTFATAIGGYPSGSYVLGDDLKTVYRCTTDGNTANPNTTTTGWAKVANDISDILGLGTAATKNTGNGTGQIPTMANFTSGSGWIKFPDGTIIQTGTSISGPVGFPTTITFPIPFTVSYRIATSFDTAATGAADCPAFATTPAGGGLLAFYLMSSRTSGAGAGANWIAIGK